MQPPLSWIRQIHHALEETKQIPLHGFPPSFPWEALSQEIANLFSLSESVISLKNVQFLPGSELTSGFGADPIFCTIELTPLIGKAYFLIGREEMQKLTTLLLSESISQRGLSSPEFQEGFYHFLVQKAVLALNHVKAFDPLFAQMGMSTTLPEEDAVCIDVEISLNQERFWGRVICPESLHQGFKSHFSTQNPIEFSKSLTNSIAQSIDISLQVVVGKTSLKLSQFKTLHSGDFLILDHCSFDPNTHKGTATLELENHPLIRAKIKENSLKITGYALLNEEDTSMHNEIPEEENEKTDQYDPNEEILEENDHLWATENEVPSIEQMLPRNEIPLVVTVEVDRINMKLDQLLQLSAGNVLELSVRPEHGVTLTIGGKKVAKAELVKLGDLLGVKILQIGS